MIPLPSKAGRSSAGTASVGAPRLRAIAFAAALAFAGLTRVFPAAGNALQFDVFLGYGGQPTGTDGLIHEIGWSAVACEVHNPGPGFDAVFEFALGQLGNSPTCRFALELPTNTRKRFVLPFFAGASYSTWNARLLDGRGRVRAELNNLQARGVAWESVLLGALPRTFAGLPVLPQIVGDLARSTHQPATARLVPELLPDNPIALEGIDALYLNSDRAAELNPAQANALVHWLRHGGHLILALEDPASLLGSPWLEPLLPLTADRLQVLRPADALRAWGNPLPTVPPPADRPHDPLPPQSPAANEPAFPKYTSAQLFHAAPLTASPRNTASTNSLSNDDFTVVVGTVTDGQILLAIDQTPLIVRAKRGRGVITVLTFSPEREPFLSWPQRGWFWARLLELPGAWYRPTATPQFVGFSIDSLIGVLLDSRQIRTLPLSWLLLLLAVYLAVIGPIDRLVLQRFRREMLTWLTFPAYVLLFSLLIYFVGFRLRAGDTEWNELHIVDFMPSESADSWRGRTYASVYSPSTTRYPLASTLPHATLRGELLGLTQTSGDLTVTYRDQGFLAEVAVPVWTSQLLVSDWTGSNSPPFSARLLGRPGDQRLVVQNHLDRPLRELRLLIQGKVYELTELGPHAGAEHLLTQTTPRALHEFVFQATSPVFALIQQRQFAFGSNNRSWPPPSGAILTAASFAAYTGAASPIRDRQITAPADFDLSPIVDRGDAALIAWIPDYAPVSSFRNFSALRTQQNTLFRLSLPLASAPPSQP